MSGNVEETKEKSSKPKSTKILVEIINSMKKYTDQNGNKYFEITEKDAKTLLVEVHAQVAINWIQKAYFDKVQDFVDAKRIHAAIGVAWLTQSSEIKAIKVCKRIGFNDGKIYLDLANKESDVIEICENGVGIVKDPPVRFLSDSLQKELPVPDSSEGFKEIFKYLNVYGQEKRMLLLATICSMLRADMARPILGIIGREGSAKTTCAKIIRYLIDPKEPVFTSAPSDDKNLAIIMHSNAVVCFDNLHAISRSASDMFCKTTTGAGHEARALYTDGGIFSIAYKRPIIFTSLEMPSNMPDFLDRCVHIELTRIGDTAWRSENELFENFLQERPRILGGMLHTISDAMEIEKKVKINKSVRLNEFARFGAAVCKVLGYDPNEFVKYLIQNMKSEKSKMKIENDPLAQSILDIVTTRNMYEGYTSELAEVINKDLKPAQRINSQKLGHCLNRNIGTFENLGFKVHKARDGKGTFIRIEYDETKSNCEYSYRDPFEYVTILSDDEFEKESEKVKPEDYRRIFLYNEKQHNEEDNIFG